MKTTEMNEAAQEFTQEAREAAGRWQEKAMEKARAATEVTDRYVHENVWLTVAAAAMIGCTIGYLVGRSQD